jgi:hypothetical protein
MPKGNDWSSPLRTEDDETDQDFDDENKPRDGLLGYWTFINGEQLRLFAALAAAFFAVLWCFLYILGTASTPVGTVLFVLAAISFGTWPAGQTDSGIRNEGLEKK